MMWCREKTSIFYVICSVRTINEKLLHTSIHHASVGHVCARCSRGATLVVAAAAFLDEFVSVADAGVVDVSFVDGSKSEYFRFCG